MEQEKYTVRPLEFRDIPEALDIVNEHLGAGMYTQESMADFIHSKHQFFYLFHDAEGIAGLFCFQTMVARELDNTHGYTKGIWKGLCREDDLVGIYRGSVVLERARGHNLAGPISVPYVNKLFDEEGISLFVGAAWIKGDYVPAKNLLEANGMVPGPRMPRAWYACKEMYCPYCKQQPCICDAQLYYRKKEDFPIENV